MAQILEAPINVMNFLVRNILTQPAKNRYFSPHKAVYSGVPPDVLR